MPKKKKERPRYIRQICPSCNGKGVVYVDRKGGGAIELCKQCGGSGKV